MPLDKSQIRLSARELQVIRLIAANCSDKEIARRLAISLSTVRNYLRIIYRVTGIRKRTGLCTWALKNELVTFAELETLSA